MASLKIKLLAGIIAVAVVIVIGFYVYASIVPHDTTITLSGPPTPVNGPITARPGSPG